MIDLHVHSTFSDGSLTPAELVALAADSGVDTLALTDHDTTEGVAPFLAACRESGRTTGFAVCGIPGVEISVWVPSGTMHILGYFADDGHQGFRSLLERIRAGRSERNRQILAKLNEQGLPMEWDEVAVFSSDGVVGRPHFARAMVRRGYVISLLKAFDLYLARGKPAYSERFRPSTGEAIGTIRAAGGVPVLAHPLTLGLSGSQLRARVRSLAEEGLQGIEVYHSEHTRERENTYQALADEFGLLVAGGSDFHGDSNPAIRLGRGFGSLNVPREKVAPMLSRGAGYPGWVPS